MSEKTWEIGNHPELPAPNQSSGLVKWLRENLFSSVSNTVLTFLGFYLLYSILPPLVNWMFIDSVVLNAESRLECEAINDGACWAFIYRRWDQFVYGFYPAAERWRVNLSFLFVAIVITIALVEKIRAMKGAMYVVLWLKVCILPTVVFICHNL